LRELLEFIDEGGLSMDVMLWRRRDQPCDNTEFVEVDHHRAIHLGALVPRGRCAGATAGAAAVNIDDGCDAGRPAAVINREPRAEGVCVSVLLRLGAVLLGAAVLAACGGNGSGGEIDSSLEEALRAMVLQPEDLPEGLERADESFTSNDDLISASADQEVTRERLERWGRLLGYEVTYQPSAAALGQSPVNGMSVSSSLYANDEGASESFADAVQTSEETDWAANYPGLRDFQQDTVDVGGLADEIVWLRMSGFQPATSGSDALITDDLIFFRVSRERGFLRVLSSSTETEDRQYYQKTVEGWLQTLVQRVRDVLEEPGFEVGEE
jgi:hypothetical protein